MNDINDNGVLYRVCNKCRKKYKLSSDNFHRNKTKRNGYALECKKCVSYRNKKRYSNLTAEEKAVKNQYIKEFRKLQNEKGLCQHCKEPKLSNSVYCEKHYLKYISKRLFGTVSKYKLLKNKLEKQDYKCAYTGDKLILGLNASADHIKPLSTHTHLYDDVNNIQWTTIDVNIMKLNHSEEDFFQLVKKIYEFNDL